jgi:hypothetical protein
MHQRRSTLNTTDDITQILESGGYLLEFLDLTETRQMTVDQAVTAFGSEGFRWANGVEVFELFDAFDITYAISPDSITHLAYTAGGPASFVSYLGNASGSGVASIGYVEDLTTETHHTYACVGPLCDSTASVNNLDYLWPKLLSGGVFMVRGTPEPGSGTLMGLGLVGLRVAAKRRREQKKKAHFHYHR